jgi:hypothetical protein
MVNNRWVDLVIVMLANPPDPNEPLPRVNQSSTICGVIFSFLVRLVPDMCLVTNANRGLLRSSPSFVLVSVCMFGVLWSESLVGMMSLSPWQLYVHPDINSAVGIY